jgi:hypothetical protein
MQLSHTLKTDSTFKKGSIEELKDILSQRGEGEITLDEAKEVGNALIELYEILASEDEDESNS